MSISNKGNQKMREILFILLSVASLNIYAATQNSATGKVLNVWVHSDSYNPYTENSPVIFMVEIDGLPKACGGSHKRFAIGGQHPAYNTVVSMILSAQATGKEVTLNYLDTCSVRSNAWDFAYLQLMP